MNKKGVFLRQTISASEHEKAPSLAALPIRRGNDSCSGGVFRDQDEGFYITEIQEFQHRWGKYVHQKR